MIVVMVRALILSSILSSTVATQDGAEAPGTDLYRRQCSNCHQLSGAPVESIERIMRVTMRHLGSPDVQAKSDAELRRDVLEGVGKMSAIRNVSEEGAADLVAYMRNLTAP